MRSAQLFTKTAFRNAARTIAYDFGSAESDARPVSWVAEQMAGFRGDGASRGIDQAQSPHEAGYLKLDSSRARAGLGWTSQLRLQEALELLVAWYRAWHSGSEMNGFTLNQIEQYRSCVE
jgi:CDP-glucose 4,6-dehydratase